MDPEGEGKDEMNWEVETGIYSSPCVKETASGELPYNTELRSVLCDDLEGVMVRVGGWSRREGMYDSYG